MKCMDCRCLRPGTKKRHYCDHLKAMGDILTPDNLDNPPVWCPLRTASGIQQIMDERAKQLAKWTPEHDDSHMHSELASEAACLILASNQTSWDLNDIEDFRCISKHRGDRISMLRIAGALCAAEIDRLQRAAEKGVAK